jgi:hypothetical protein
MEQTLIKPWDTDAIKEKLRETICQVTFTKVDGSVRVMKCTLNESMIPSIEQDNVGEKKKRPENPDIQRVYDVEAKGWRSFKWNSLTQFHGELNT